MKNYILVLFTFYPILLFSQKLESRQLTKEEISQKKIEGITNFPIFEAYEFEDKEGLHYLALGENPKKDTKKDTLNIKIQAVCIHDDNGTFLEQWRINDLLEDYNTKETDIGFWTKYCSFDDLDRDGSVDPILVYGTRTKYGEVRRLKIITIYKNNQYTIRALECELENCKSLKKDSNWNALPQKVRTYVDKLIIKLRKEQNLVLKER